MAVVEESPGNKQLCDTFLSSGAFETSFSSETSPKLTSDNFVIFDTLENKGPRFSGTSRASFTGAGFSVGRANSRLTSLSDTENCFHSKGSSGPFSTDSQMRTMTGRDMT